MKSFLSDTDGLSAKDAVIVFGGGGFLILLFSAAFIELLHSIGIVQAGVSDAYVEILKTAIAPVSTAVGGVFGVQIVESVKRKDYEPYIEEGDKDESVRRV